VGLTEKPQLPRLDPGGDDPGAAHKGSRRVFVPEDGVFADAAVFDGHRLRAGNRLAGPALIERTDTTVFVSRGFTAAIDDVGSCLIRPKEGRP
jgi:N-methylhydantoinase A